MYKVRVIENYGKAVNSTPFDTTDIEGQLLGEKILASINYGTDVGALVSVEYDEDVVENADAEHQVDVLCDANLDFFDIGEKFGEMVEAQAPPVPSPTPDEHND